MAIKRKKKNWRSRFTTPSARNAIACARDTICLQVLINSFELNN